MIKNKAGIHLTTKSELNLFYVPTLDGPVEKKSKFGSSDACSGMILMIKSQSPLKSSH
jgi:hypothetical protein